MTALYNFVNPKNGKHSPLISKDTHEIIMKNADVSEKMIVNFICSLKNKQRQVTIFNRHWCKFSVAQQKSDWCVPEGHVFNSSQENSEFFVHGFCHLTVEYLSHYII